MPNFHSKTLSLIHGPHFLTKIQSTKVLVAGAGGVGAELLKNLALTGFQDITLIDLDLIDISNLNRHIYIRREHAITKQSKAEVVSKTVTAQYPHLRIHAYYVNIMDFGPEFFGGFDIVFCALDAREAREYLGRMCIIANKPMIEAGTHGFSGQVKTQIKGVSECKLCLAPKQYEEFVSCSVRAIPVHSLHVVQWAKDFYNRLFNEGDDKDVSNLLSRKWDNEEDYRVETDRLGRVLFERYFNEDIQQYHRDEIVILGRQRVFPLSYGDALKKTEATDDSKDFQRILANQKLWSISKCAEEFSESFKRCIIRKVRLGDEKLILDKDDNDMISFLCAVINLRIYNFQDVTNPMNQLNHMSLFEIKEKVGEIIPTVASTNSIVAAIQIIEALKFTEEDVDSMRSIYVSNNKTGKLTPASNPLPRINCSVCSYSNIYLKLSIGPNTTLQSFKKLMEQYYMIQKPQIFIQKLVYDAYEDDEDMLEIYQRKLKQTIMKILVKNSGSKDKGNILVKNLDEAFVFDCYVYVDQDLDAEIKLGEDCLRETVIEQQRGYLQQVYTEKKRKLNRLYEKHLFSLDAEIDNSEHQNMDDLR